MVQFIRQRQLLHDPEKRDTTCGASLRAVKPTDQFSQCLPHPKALQDPLLTSLQGLWLSFACAVAALPHDSISHDPLG